MNKEKLFKEFKKDVCLKAKEVDPGDEQDWFSLSLGYFLAKGCSPEESWDLSSEVRYDLEYWTKEPPKKYKTSLEERLRRRKRYESKKIKRGQ